MLGIAVAAEVPLHEELVPAPFESIAAPVERELGAGEVPDDRFGSGVLGHGPVEGAMPGRMLSRMAGGALTRRGGAAIQHRDRLVGGLASRALRAAEIETEKAAREEHGSGDEAGPHVGPVDHADSR